MSKNIIYLSKDNFEQEVLKATGPVFVDFWAEWCGPCRMLAPIFEELAGDFDGKIKFAKLNIDEEGELAMAYRVMSIPTLILFENGAPSDKLVGLRSAEEIADWLDQFVK